MSEPLICYEDAALLALHKPAGMPSQPDPTRDCSLLQWAEEYAGKPLRLIHRLDRPVSGIVLLAKTRQAMAQVQRQWIAGQVQKWYAAIVAGDPPQEEGTLTHFLVSRQGSARVRVFLDEQPGSMRAQLHYWLVGRGERYCFLLVHPITGRHHQIRAQLAAVGCPVKGDVRYGARRGHRDRSIGLHAWQIHLAHPISGLPLRAEAVLPQSDALWKVAAQAFYSSPFQPKELMGRLGESPQ